MSEELEPKLNEDEIFIWHLARLCVLLADGKQYISKDIAECFTAPKLGLHYAPRETLRRFARTLVLKAAYDYKLRTELGEIDPKKAS